MTDQKLLQEAIDRSKNARRIGISPHSTVQAILEEAAEKHLASLTPVPDQARAEALAALETLVRLCKGEEALESHGQMAEIVRTIRQCLQTPPVTADTSEVEKMQVPEGWQLVPVEPTDDMLMEGRNANVGPRSTVHNYLYTAMLAAAPKHAETIAKEGE